MCDILAGFFMRNLMPLCAILFCHGRYSTSGSAISSKPEKKRVVEDMAVALRWVRLGGFEGFMSLGLGLRVSGFSGYRMEDFRCILQQTSRRIAE